jgi:uncharacterized repeat protein (TIGR01451 family)
MTTRGRTIRAAVLSLALASYAGPAWAKPRIEISIAQAREVVEVKGGVSSVTLAPVQTASPGDVVQYTLTFVNAGDQLARDAVIDDPIPKGTTFASADAPGDGVELRYSADGGKTFAPADQLTRAVQLPSGQVEKRAVPPSEYTHLRWTVRQLPPGARGAVSFRVRVN